MFHNGIENNDMSTRERNRIYLLRPFFDKAHILYTENYSTSA